MRSKHDIADVTRDLPIYPEAEALGSSIFTPSSPSIPIASSEDSPIEPDDPHDFGEELNQDMPSPSSRSFSPSNSIPSSDDELSNDLGVQDGHEFYPRSPTGSWSSRYGHDEAPIEDGYNDNLYSDSDDPNDHDENQGHHRSEVSEDRRARVDDVPDEEGPHYGNQFSDDNQHDRVGDIPDEDELPQKKPPVTRLYHSIINGIY
jgi:hypothetical protein